VDSHTQNTVVVLVQYTILKKNNKTTILLGSYRILNVTVVVIVSKLVFRFRELITNMRRP